MFLPIILFLSYIPYISYHISYLIRFYLIHYLSRRFVITSEAANRSINKEIPLQKTHAIIYKIYNVKPGLTGIGSIVFRDEEYLISSIKGDDYHEFYKKVIAPYKGELEMWYQKNNSIFF
mgnify:CR=1 FL=1